MGLRAYIAKRILFTIVTIFAILTINFIIFQVMPGSPMEIFASPGRIKDEKTLELLKKKFGLDEPLINRYFKYMMNLLQFEFGVSYFSNKPVAEEIGEKLFNTLLLQMVVAVISITVGICLGVLAAYKRGGKFDSFIVPASLITYALPSFWIGMMLLIIFAKWLGWFPTGGTMPREWMDPNIWPQPPKWPDDWMVIIAGRLKHLFLPAFTLVIFSYGGWLLLTRATMLETLTEDFVLTAEAKGLPRRIVLFKHAFKNASLPIITNAALTFGFMLTGAVITEQVFTWKGLGWWLWNAIQAKDYPCLQAIFYLIALCVIAANFIADLLYGIIDPRIKYG